MRQLRQAITLMRMDKDGVLNEPGISASAALARLDELGAFYNVENTWVGFRTWVQETQPRESWLTVRQLKTRTLSEQVCCTPKVVCQCIDHLESLLVEVGIAHADSKAIIPSEAHRLLCTDEKGLSQRQDAVFRGVAPRGAKATGTMPTCPWEHLSICSFLPLAGESYPLCIVTPTKKVHPDFAVACPSAFFWGNPGGSNSSTSFAYFLNCIGQHAREQKGIPLAQEMVIVLDTGGGALLHVNTDIMRVAMAWRLRLFFLPSYTTRALMALDQHVHQVMSSSWKAFKQQWSSKSQPLSLFIALRAVHDFSKRALSTEIASSSWKRIGCEVGKAWDRDTLLVTRADEIFNSVRSVTTMPASSALSALRLTAGTKNKCKGEGCGQFLEATMKLCWNCGAVNASFDQEQFDIHKRGFRGGWQKNAELEMSKLSPKEEALLGQVDDIMKDMNKRAAKKQEDVAAVPEQAVDEIPAAPLADTSKPADEIVPAAEQEFDLDSSESCVEFIVAHWTHPPADLPQVARYFVDTLKARSTKLAPLSDLMQKEVVTKNILKSKAGRQSWFNAWSSNRSKRFVKPTYLKK